MQLVRLSSFRSSYFGDYSMVPSVGGDTLHSFLPEDASHELGGSGFDGADGGLHLCPFRLAMQITRAILHLAPLHSE
jgi:hypothetical protein